MVHYAWKTDVCQMQWQWKKYPDAPNKWYSDFEILWDWVTIKRHRLK